jgi:hypothetical protein
MHYDIIDTCLVPSDDYCLGAISGKTSPHTRAAPEISSNRARLCDGIALPHRRSSDAQEKMPEYLDSGVRLGWLLNPQDQQVEIYRQGQAVEVRSLPTQLSGEQVLPGFSLQVERFTDL